MNKLEQAARQALEALEEAREMIGYPANMVLYEKELALREALAKPDIEEMTLTQIAARHKQAEQEPVAFMFKVKRTTKSITVLDEFAAIDYFPQDNEEIVSKEPLSYAAPVERQWVDLTDEEQIEIEGSDEVEGEDYNSGYTAYNPYAIMDLAIAKFKEKNTPPVVPQGEPDVDLETMLKLIQTINYLVGIAERGEGRKIFDTETPEQFVLGYVKKLEQPQGEPVAWLYDWEHEGEIVTGWVTQDFETTKFNNGHNVRPLYAAPVRTKDLTDDEIDEIESEILMGGGEYIDVIRAVIAKFKEKNRV